MLNYSIMTLNKEYIEEYCRDIEYQVKNKIATMPLFCMTLTPEGDPAIDKAELLCTTYEKYKARLDEMGVPSGVLIQATIGHGWKLNQSSAFQKYVNLNNGGSPEVCCPLDEDFRAYIRRSAARIASTHPHHIMLDDDFRLMERGGRGCACPLHMAEFNRLAGTNLSREELYAALKEGPEHPYRKLFIKTQIDSLIGCAREIRAGIDSVDPTIPGSYCLCGDGAEGGYEIASIMAGAGNPVIVRLNNANYCAKDPRNFTHIMRRAAHQISALTGKPDVILAETDTCPQNRYSTPAAMLHSHFTFSILEGAAGAKQWITRLSSFEPASGVAYRKKLEKHAGFYAELSRIFPSLTWLGCRIPVPSHSHLILTDASFESFHNWGWQVRILDRFGLPMHYSAKGEGAVFFDGAIDRAFTDEELLSILSGNVVLDATAAERLIARGFGKYVGVELKRREPDAKNASGEFVYPSTSPSDRKDTRALHGIREITSVANGVKIYSEAYHLRDGVYKDVLFPVVTAFKNELGGTVAVFAGESYFDLNLVDAFGWLNETRKAELADVLCDMGVLPIYYPDDAEVLMKAARTEDGKLFCAILDMSLDSIETLPLTVKTAVSSIKRLTCDGSYETVSFTQKGERVEIDTVVYPYDPAIFIIE